jgi:hypothetical protein
VVAKGAKFTDQLQRDVCESVRAKLCRIEITGAACTANICVYLMHSYGYIVYTCTHTFGGSFDALKSRFSFALGTFMSCFYLDSSISDTKHSTHIHLYDMDAHVLKGFPAAEVTYA